MSTARAASVITPAGRLVIVATADAVLASGWSDNIDEVVARVHPSIRPASLSEARDLGPITRAVRRYLAGDFTALDEVPVHQVGGPFLEKAWAALRAVPAGHPVTYTELAAAAGNPSAVRAAASACARNAPALFVPCHRVVRRGGGLGGFRWGLDVKRWLLDHEAAPASTGRLSPAPSS
ncbi:MAG TPA: methylated-DNA--[protein]-cysteine S-methyltransferase [Acidimicrobiales bacterium]